jgi:hypothetical protein
VLGRLSGDARRGDSGVHQCLRETAADDLGLPLGRRPRHRRQQRRDAARRHGHIAVAGEPGPAGGQGEHLRPAQDRQVEVRVVVAEGEPLGHALVGEVVEDAVPEVLDRPPVIPREHQRQYAPSGLDVLVVADQAGLVHRLQVRAVQTLEVEARGGAEQALRDRTETRPIAVAQLTSEVGGPEPRFTQCRVPVIDQRRHPHIMRGAVT